MYEGFNQKKKHNIKTNIVFQKKIQDSYVVHEFAVERLYYVHAQNISYVWARDLALTK